MKIEDKKCKSCQLHHDHHDEYEHRNIFSHMMTSHIFLIIPSLWWLFGYNNGTFWSHVFDKTMAFVLTLSIVMSMIYHYYYECVLCDVEYNANIFGIIMLNLYMIYRGVSYIYILLGFIILLLLQYSVISFRKKKHRNV